MIKRFMYKLPNGIVLMVKRKPQPVFLISRDQALSILGISKSLDDQMQLKFSIPSESD